MTLYLSVSQARRQFKGILGHANHQIITALVGLHLIEKDKVTVAPKELNTTWSPRDPVASARRSRTLILDMALVRCVDALDVYIRLSNRLPALIQSSEVRSVPIRLSPIPTTSRVLPIPRVKLGLGRAAISPAMSSAS